MVEGGWRARMIYLSELRRRPVAVEVVEHMGTYTVRVRVVRTGELKEVPKIALYDRSGTFELVRAFGRAPYSEGYRESIERYFQTYCRGSIMYADSPLE
jgi:hypothetical protein